MSQSDSGKKSPWESNIEVLVAKLLQEGVDLAKENQILRHEVKELKLGSRRNLETQASCEDNKTGKEPFAVKTENDISLQLIVQELNEVLVSMEKKKFLLNSKFDRSAAKIEED